eukprot:TRINITY_DN8792_c0_g1_i1.p1 TRINITY_DN8792_c0_g1~~TRINITY_DN8792_c0_g1_i1.p1  ORF type:complete len:248 (-),score=87.40 TRINITY_DN8792_c0_g1_i1:258-1001(-)
MGRILVYTIPQCLYCSRVKRLLEQKGVVYVEIDITKHPKQREKLNLMGKKNEMPQIFFNYEYIGGAEAFFAMENSGELDRRLKQVIEEETPFETILFPNDNSNSNNQQTTAASAGQSGALNVQSPSTTKELFSLSSSPTERYEAISTSSELASGNYDYIEEYYDTTTILFAASASDPSNASEFKYEGSSTDFTADYTNEVEEEDDDEDDGLQIRSKIEQTVQLWAGVEEKRRKQQIEKAIRNWKEGR